MKTKVWIGVLCLAGVGCDVPPGSVTVTPATATVQGNATQQFSAQIKGAADSSVTWTVDETSGGSVTLNGLYTAPRTQGTYHVRATSVATPAQSASAEVTVTAPPDIVVTVTPSMVTFAVGGVQQFAASVSGSANTAVTWSVDEAGGGQIGVGGLYSAPATAGTYHVRATSVADTSRSAAATVTVTATTVGVAVSPRTTTMQISTQQQFQVMVTGTTNQGVVWSVPNSANASVTSTGLFTAPSSPGTVVLTATSVADPTKSDSATITVQGTAVVNVSISSPTTTRTVPQGGSQRYFTVVTGTTNTAVTWTTTGGAISTIGNFTAGMGPTAPGTFTITATSVADPTKSATAQVIVPEVVVAVTPKTATLFSANRTGSNPTSATFVASVTGAQATTVNWTIGQPDGGTVTTEGVYLSPVMPGTYTVIATSTVDTTKNDTATITVNPAAIVVTITPTTATLNANAQQRFTATAANSDAGVVFSVQAGGAGGVVDQTGNYTAPGAAGSDAVVATSVQDPTKSARATITVR